jgi:hypothetical protein
VKPETRTFRAPPPTWPSDHPSAEVRAFQARYGKFGKRERRYAKLADVAVRESGSAEADFTIKGYAAVFGKESLNLGWFTEFIDPGAFDRVLSEDPDVHLNINHDMNLVLARTKVRSGAGALDLGTDRDGLRMWARPVPTTYAEDLRSLMEVGVVDQASFCFTIARDEWRYEYDSDGTERSIRTILEIGSLYDVCVTPQGAYPDTSTEVGRSSDAVRAYVRSYGRGRASNVALAKARARAKRLRAQMER